MFPLSIDTSIFFLVAHSLSLALSFSSPSIYVYIRFGLALLIFTNLSGFVCLCRSVIYKKKKSKHLKKERNVRLVPFGFGSCFLGNTVSFVHIFSSRLTSSFFASLFQINSVSCTHLRKKCVSNETEFWLLNRMAKQNVWEVYSDFRYFSATNFLALHVSLMMLSEASLPYIGVKSPEKVKKWRKKTHRKIFHLA